MKFYVIKIHGRPEIYIKDENKWFIVDYSPKKGYHKVETVLTEDRQKKAREINIFELMANSRYYE